MFVIKGIIKRNVRGGPLLEIVAIIRKSDVSHASLPCFSLYFESDVVPAVGL